MRGRPEDACGSVAPGDGQPPACFRAPGHTGLHWAFGPGDRVLYWWDDKGGLWHLEMVQ